MATFLGEVMPLSSRAVDDDEDLNIEELEVVINKPNILNIDINLILLATGESACHVANNFILHKQSKGLKRLPIHDLLESAVIIKKIIPDTSEDDLINGLDYRKGIKELLVAYQHPEIKEALIATSAKYIRPEHSSEIINLLFNKFKLSPSLQIITLTSENSVFYKNSSICQPESFPLVQYLHTSNFNDGLNSLGEKSSWLKVPNLLTGLSAAALTECEVAGLSALSLVCYEQEPGLPSAIALFHILKALPTVGKLLREEIQASFFPTLNTDTVNLYT